MERYQSDAAFAEQDRRLVDLLDAEFARLDWRGALAMRWWSRGLVGVETADSPREYGSYYHLVIALPDGRAWNAWLPFIGLPEIIAGAYSPEGEIDLGVFFGDLETIASQARDAVTKLTGLRACTSTATTNENAALDLRQLDSFGELRAHAGGTSLSLNADVRLFQWQTPDHTTSIVPVETNDPAAETQDITSVEHFPGPAIRSTNDGQRWELRALNTPHHPR